MAARRWIWMGAIMACDPGRAAIGVAGLDDEPAATSSGWTDAPYVSSTPEEPPDLSAYDEAVIDVVAPLAGGLVVWESITDFEAVLHDGAGLLLTPDAVSWVSDTDLDFHGEALSFQSDTLEVGLHTLTVRADLPTGLSVAHSLGRVRVQSVWAGTYAGLFQVDGTVNGVTVSCTGAGVVVLRAQGDAADGDADCLVSLLGADIPMTWLLELEQADGVVSGGGSVDLAGIFTWGLPAEGSIDPTTQVMTVTFAGPIPIIGELAASFSADRVSLDAGL